MRRSPRLPKRFPVGTKYILESYGGFVRRYIEYPSGRRIELETRKALSCGCFDSSIVPERGADTLNSEPEKFKAKFDLFAGADEGTEERIRTDSIWGNLGLGLFHRLSPPAGAIATPAVRPSIVLQVAWPLHQKGIY